MSKIQLTDNTMDVVVKMSEGNPGAMNALMEILSKGKLIDTDDPIQGLGAILMLDTLGIYGSDIYVLHSDICDRNLAKTLAVIRGTQFGYFDGKLLANACHRQDYSGRDIVPVEELYQKVKERLPNFDAGSADV
jgi:hypothetical protein